MDALTLLAFGYMAAMVILANLGCRYGWARTLTWALSIVVVILLVARGMIELVTILPLRPRTRVGINSTVAAAIFLGTGVAIAACLVPGIRRQLARLLPIDPGNPVHVVGLELYLLVLANGLLDFFATDPLATIAGQPPQSMLDIFLGEIPFILFALLGVGFLIRRNLRQTLVRLGLVRPEPFHVALALVVAQLVLVLGSVMDLLGRTLTPDLDRRVNDVTTHLFRPDGSPLIYFAVLSIMAGSGEEILFRGALQPRLGILLTTLLFASGHIQYGISFALLQVFAGGLIFGWMRQRTNTTTSLLSHITYDSLTTMLALAVGAMAEHTVGLVFEILLALLVLQVVLLLVWWVRRMEKRQPPAHPIIKE